MITNGAGLLEACAQMQCNLGQLSMQMEAKAQDIGVEDVKARLREALQVMRSSANRTLEKPVASVSGLTSGQAHQLCTYAEGGNSLLGQEVLRGVAHGLSSFEVNASMGRIVAAPTAGSCGILPGVLMYVEGRTGCGEDALLEALAAAGAVGQAIAENATLSGAAGGCQAECGAAASMAAAAAVQLMGGTPEQALNAAAVALQNIMGLVCDPVAGLVEVPCAKRNALGVLNALVCADMALAGIPCLIPFDETVEAMYRVGKALPEELRETALGGLAATPTAQAITKQIFG
nr:L-serine ammonia-lyase, iron-sulfur-dependent, subunit alpha [bacterium]